MHFSGVLDMLAESIPGTPVSNYDPGDHNNFEDADEEPEPAPVSLWNSRGQEKQKQYGKKRNEAKRKKTLEKMAAFLRGGGETGKMRKARVRKERRLEGIRSPARAGRIDSRTTIKFRKTSREVRSLTKSLLQRDVTIEELKAAIAAAKNRSSIK